LALRAQKAASPLVELKRRSLMEAGVHADEGGPELPWREPASMGFPGDGICAGALVAFFILSCELSFQKLAFPWLPSSAVAHSVWAGMATLGAWAAWLLSKLRRGPKVDALVAPDPRVDSPLVELHDFAAGCSRAFIGHGRRQWVWAVVLFAILGTVLGWATLLYFLGHGRFAMSLGPSAALAASLILFNWKPFALARYWMRVAKRAKEVTEEIARDIRDVSALPPSERKGAQWKRVRALLFDIPTG
jgi:hypothetical protein